MPLEDLKKRLYKPKETFEERMSTPELERKSRGRRIKWTEESEMTLKKTGSGIFWGAVITLVILLGGGLALFLSGFPSFLQIQKLEVEVVGENEIRSGGLAVWEVTLINRGGAPLNDAVIVFNYPQDSAPGSSRARVITGLADNRRIFKERRPVGTLGAGGTARESFDAFVFGKAGTAGKVSAVVEYRPEGASAVFAKAGEFTFLIARSPISVAFDIPGEIRSGQDVEMSANYISQSDEEIKDLYLRILLPGNFEISSLVPAPMKSGAPFELKENELAWRIGTLKPAQAGKINIRGKLTGSELEPKNFESLVGIFDERVNDFLSYDEAVEVVVLRPKFLEVAMAMNGKLEYTSVPGDFIIFEVNWRNNLPTDITNASLEVFLEGDAIDFSTLRVEKGAYRQSTQSAVWNTASYEQFRGVPPGETGTNKFSFRVKKDLSRDSSATRPTIKAKAIFRSGGTVAGFEGVDITGSSEVEIPVSSSLQLVSQIFYFNAPIPNTGPIPAQVGQETTYTVIWSLANMANDTENIVVRSSLPAYVSFKNIVTPTDMDLIYRESTGEIVWNVSHLPAGAGFINPALQVAFQIGFVPSPSQVGFSPDLINDSSAKGKDRFTGVILSATDKKVTAALPDDPAVGFNQRGVAR